MSTGLMSCVRENTPPLDRSEEEMQAEITTMSSEYSEPQKRRRFNALKNLRRIFRRRTVASTETLPTKGKIRSHISPSGHHHHNHHHLHDHHPDGHHFRDPYQHHHKQPSLVSVRSTTTLEERGDFECSGRVRSTTLDYGQEATAIAGVGHGGVAGKLHQSRAARGSNGGGRSNRYVVEDYSFEDTRRRHSHHRLLLTSSPGDRVSVHVNGDGLAGSSDWTHKRSHSEDRLKEGAPLDQEISKSHESVFRESNEMAMLTIGLKTELIDVLRKRRSRPDASPFENNLGHQHDATTGVAPKRSSAEMFDLRNTLPSPRRSLEISSEVQSYATRRITAADVPDLAPLSHHSHYQQQIHQRMSYTPGSSAPKDPLPAAPLSHSAARHKMAVRPKKKGPTRFRRSVEAATNSSSRNQANDPNITNGLGEVATVDKSSPPEDPQKEEISSKGLSSDNLPSKSSSSINILENSDQQHSSPFVSRTKTGIPCQKATPERQMASSNSPPKTGFSYFESLKAAYRSNSNSNVTKSEEHLQESSKSPGLANNELMGHPKPTGVSASSSPCFNKISVGRRRSVEKSQSFKIFSSHPPATPNSIDAVSDRKELFNLNRPVSYKEFSKPQVLPRSDLRSVLEGSSPNKTNSVPEPVHPVSAKSNNIVQIEENIDKLVSNPFVPLLKKTATVSEEKLRSSNVSITTIGSVSLDKSSSSEESSPSKSPGVILRRRSSSKIEKSPSVGSLNTLENENKVPEFMRIHLNRVENTRPKSSIVLYKGTSDTLPRRFSRELDSTKPPLPPVLSVSTLKRPSINKSQETITESNHVIIVPVATSPRKSSVELSSTSAAPKPLEVTPLKPTNSSVAPTPAIPIPEAKKAEDFLERKGSVSEEKAKIERRLSIADEKSFVRKRSLQSASNTSPSKSGNKEDNTPELMKVFARRSMKLKDDDEELPAPVVQKSDSRSSMVTDSDKENQSSSREELSSPKISEESPVSLKEQKTRPTGDSGYRTRTFLEVKNMLQGSQNQSLSALRTQKSANERGSETKKEQNASLQSSRKSVLQEESKTATSSGTGGLGGSAATNPDPDGDKLPEFKRIVERREEWESRAKMWK